MEITHGIFIVCNMTHESYISTINTISRTRVTSNVRTRSRANICCGPIIHLQFYFTQYTKYFLDSVSSPWESIETNLSSLSKFLLYYELDSKSIIHHSNGLPVITSSYNKSSLSFSYHCYHALSNITKAVHLSSLLIDARSLSPRAVLHQ